MARKSPKEQDLPHMPFGDVPKSIRDTAEKYINEKIELVRQKNICNAIEGKLLLEMAREKVRVAIVIHSHKKYYVRLEHKADKIKVEVGPVVPSTTVSLGAGSN